MASVSKRLWADRLRTKPGNEWIATDRGHSPLTPTVNDSGAVSELTGCRRHKRALSADASGPNPNGVDGVLLALEHC